MKINFLFICSLILFNYICAVNQVINFKPIKNMSETNEIQSRIDSLVEVIKRNNPTLKQQLAVAFGAANSLKNEALSKVSQKESELEILKNEINEVLQ